LPEITAIACNMKGCLRIFFVSYFDYRHIWLNIFMDACHLSNITKLKRKRKRKTLVLTSLFGYCSQPKKKGCCLPAP
jgi:hypothetical protein